MPAAFFRARPELEGVREGDYAALCTSRPDVRRWLTDSLAYVFQPGAGPGRRVHNHRVGKPHELRLARRPAAVPALQRRPAAEIIAEVNAAIEAGVHRGNPRAKAIVWDWGWPDDGGAADIIAGLPKHGWLKSVSEWSLPIVRGGVATR